MEDRTVVATGVDPAQSYGALTAQFSRVGTVEKIVRVLDDRMNSTDKIYVVYASADSVSNATMQLSKEGVTVQKLGSDKSEFKALVMEDAGTGVGFMQQWQNYTPEQQQIMLQKMMQLSVVKQEVTDLPPPAAAKQEISQANPVTVKQEAPKTPLAQVPELQGAVGGVQTQNGAAQFPDSHIRHPPHTPASFFNDNVVIQQKLPHIPAFSGTEKDCSFGRWKFEVECVAAEEKYTDSTKREAVRKSLRSPAADVLPRLGVNPSVTQIINKLESIHGIVLSGQALMEKFYKEEQGSRSCAKWSTHLEDWIYQALCKKALPAESVPATLKHRFWSGLQNTDIKNALRHRLDILTFEEVVTEARAVEEELKPKDKSRSQQATSSDTSLLELLIKKLDKMESSFQTLNQEVQSLKQSSRPSANTSKSAQPPLDTSKGPVKCTKCKLEGHLHFACRMGKDVECFRCGGKEHVASGCRNKKRKDLNTQ